MTDLDSIKSELTQARNVLDTVLHDEVLLKSINDAADIMVKAISGGRKIISCGNGGSHCDAMHFAEELSGRFRNERKALPAMAISDPSHITCAGNDYGFEFIFSRFIEGLGMQGDILLALSTSGNSSNILHAIEAAKAKGMITVLLTGNDGGKGVKTADHSLIVPHHGYSDRIQEIHIKIIHILILLLENKLQLI